VMCARTGTSANGSTLALRATVPSLPSSPRRRISVPTWSMVPPALDLQDVPVPTNLAPEVFAGGCLS
jgi:hypothetical protein